MGADIMTEKSEILYKLMLRKGYPEAFSRVIAAEMLAIQSDRDRIRDKHISEHAQAKINGLYRNINE